jgi:VanZ family protein
MKLFESACRVLGLAGIGLIIVLSLVPGSSRPSSGAGGWSEHLLAYAAVMLALGVGYGGMRRVMTMCTALLAGAAALELMQLLVPGRNSEFSGFVASASGIAVGAVLAATARLAVTALADKAQP